MGVSEDMVAEEEKKEQEAVEKGLAVKNILIEGCVNDEAKQVLSQMLERRLAELDPEGLQAKFILRLQNELNAMPDCQEMLSNEGK